MKTEGHLGRCYLKGRAGDAANAILTTVGRNFRRILAWLRIFLASTVLGLDIAAQGSEASADLGLAVVPSSASPEQGAEQRLPSGAGHRALAV